MCHLAALDTPVSTNNFDLPVISLTMLSLTNPVCHPSVTRLGARKATWIEEESRDTSTLSRSCYLHKGCRPSSVEGTSLAQALAGEETLAVGLEYGRNEADGGMRRRVFA